MKLSDFSQIKYEGNHISMARLNGNIVWEGINPDFYIEYTIDNSYGGNLGLMEEDITNKYRYTYLPRIIMSDDDSNLNIPLIEITLTDGTVLRGKSKCLDTSVTNIEKVKVYYKEDACGLRFEGSKISRVTNINHINTSNFTTMRGMFFGCELLTSLDLSNFDTSNVTDMSNMFWNCKSLTSLDVSNFDTSNVTDMYCMFQQCSSLTEISGLENFDTSKVRICAGMFEGCSLLVNLNISDWNCTTSSSMFKNCKSLESLDLSKWNDYSISGSELFEGCSNIHTIKLPISAKGLYSADKMFYNCSSLTTLEGIESWDVTSVTDMSYMFSGCSKLTSLDLSSWLFDDTWELDNTSHMFEMCIRLSLIDLSSFVTIGVSKYSNMFTNVPSSATIKIDSIAYKWLPNMTESATGFKGTFIRV